MADRVLSPCERFGEHQFQFSVRMGVNPNRDTCYCGAVKWADVAQARAEPPPRGMTRRDLFRFVVGAVVLLGAVSWLGVQLAVRWLSSVAGGLVAP